MRNVYTLKRTPKTNKQIKQKNEILKSSNREDVEELEISYISDGSSPILETSLSSSYKIRSTVFIWPSNYTSGYLSHLNQNICQHKQTWKWICKETVFIIIKTGHSPDVY